MRVSLYVERGRQSVGEHIALGRLYVERLLPAIAEHCGYSLSEAHEAILVCLYGRRDIEFTTPDAWQEHVREVIDLKLWLQGAAP